jgi:hypothetical protein
MPKKAQALLIFALQATRTSFLSEKQLFGLIPLSRERSKTISYGDEELQI